MDAETKMLATPARIRHDDTPLPPQEYGKLSNPPASYYTTGACGKGWCVGEVDHLPVAVLANATCPRDSPARRAPHRTPPPPPPRSRRGSPQVPGRRLPGVHPEALPGGAAGPQPHGREVERAQPRLGGARLHRLASPASPAPCAPRDRPCSTVDRSTAARGVRVVVPTAHVRSVCVCLAAAARQGLSAMPWERPATAGSVSSAPSSPLQLSFAQPTTRDLMITYGHRRWPQVCDGQNSRYTPWCTFGGAGARVGKPQTGGTGTAAASTQRR
jgi:hypothetical protein